MQAAVRERYGPPDGVRGRRDAPTLVDALRYVDDGHARGKVIVTP